MAKTVKITAREQAQKFMDTYPQGDNLLHMDDKAFIAKLLVEFAKMHVQEALKAVHKYGKESGAMNDADLPYILNSYPLTNII